MSQAVQPQVGGLAVSATNPMPVIVLEGGGTSTSTTQTATVKLGTFTSAAGALTFTIPAGALEVSLANIGPLPVVVSSPSMSPDGGFLRPISDANGAVLNPRAPQGYRLEQLTVTAGAAGVQVDYAIIR